MLLKRVRMGLRTHTTSQLAKAAGVLAIVLLTSFRVLDYFLTDTHTLTRLLGILATDVVKVGIACAASIAIAAVTATTTLASLAMGQLVVVVAVVLAVWAGLDQIDYYYGLTDRLVLALELECLVRRSPKYVDSDQGLDWMVLGP